MLAPLRTGEVFYGPVPGRHPAEAALRFLSPGVPPPSGLAETFLKVEVNHGRWLVSCRWCPGALEAFATDRRFYCVECGNGGSGQWAFVTWPEPDLQAEIERLLGDDVRLAPWDGRGLRIPGMELHAHRHWHPGTAFVRPLGWVGPAETPMQLELENRIRADVPLGPQIVTLGAP